MKFTVESSAQLFEQYIVNLYALYLKGLLHAHPRLKIESFLLHDASRSEKLSLASTCPHATMVEFKLTAELIVSRKQATPRGASVRALTFSRRAAAFSPVGASRRLQFADRCLSLRQAPRRFVGWLLVHSAHRPRSVCSLGAARNILRARQ